MKFDFNLKDAFRLFDVNNTAKISVKDLNEGLIAIGVKVAPSMSDVELVFTRYAFK